MGGLLLPLVVAGLGGVAFLFTVGVFALRRLVLVRAIGTFDCSVRAGTSHPTKGWTIGVARYEQDRLDWFRIFTLAPRPSLALARGRLVIEERRRPEGAEAEVVMRGAVILRCSYGGMVVELAMSEPAANGLAMWLESAPPGQHSVFA